MKQKYALSILLFVLAPLQLWAQKVTFNPNAPLYIEYKTSNTATKTDDVSVQIDDAKSPAKIRLSLQSKPQAVSTYYGYLWLQLGKKITNEVLFRRAMPLSGWLTQQDGIQALFLFDTEKEMTEFKNKAAQSSKPLTDKNNLPQLINPTATTPAAKVAEIKSADMDETLKYAKTLEAYNQSSAEQKKRNEAQAAQLAQSALKQYQARNYPAAEKQFDESLKLNPSVSINRYYLGISQYQNQKYNDSLAQLNLAEGADYNQAEYKYYIGLNHMKLKNYTKAVENFEDARDEDDADYSAPAAFYNGHVYFQKEDYPEARKNFEYTVDHSKNPKMDSEAEAMLEKIDAIEGFAAGGRQKFTYNLYLGAAYDSNVLNISTENQPTDVSAYRLIYGLNLDYKLLYNSTQDLALDLNASDSYSVDNKFKSNSTVQSTDPRQMSVGLPYHLRFQYGSRLFTWGFYPSYQTLDMSTGDTNARKRVLDTTVGGTDLYWAITNKHFSRVYFEYAHDKSSLDTTPENNLTANRMTVSTSQIFVTSEAAKESWTGDLAYVIEQADGDNIDYNKIGLGLTYARAGFWNTMNSARIDYAMVKYPNYSDSRDDKIAALTLGASKELMKSLKLDLTAAYTMSGSNIDTYKYNKMLVQSILTYSGGF